MFWYSLQARCSMNLTFPTCTKLLTHLHKREKSVRKLNLESLPLQGEKKPAAIFNSAFRKYQRSIYLHKILMFWCSQARCSMTHHIPHLHPPSSKVTQKRDSPPTMTNLPKVNDISKWCLHKKERKMMFWCIQQAPALCMAHHIPHVHQRGGRTGLPSHVSSVSNVTNFTLCAIPCSHVAHGMLWEEIRKHAVRA